MEESYVHDYLKSANFLVDFGLGDHLDTTVNDREDPTTYLRWARVG
jgi:hypothetical protein